MTGSGGTRVFKDQAEETETFLAKRTQAGTWEKPARRLSMNVARLFHHASVNATLKQRHTCKLAHSKT